MKKILFTLLMCQFLIGIIFCSLASAGPNYDAGIRFDLDATTYGNQNVTTISTPAIGDYLRLDCYAINVHNLDTYEFEIVYNSEKFTYVTSSATNPITYEQNILTTNGGSAIGWMVDNTVPGVLSLAYTLAGIDTLEAPEGEGLIGDIVFQVISDIADSITFGVVRFFDTFGEEDIILDKDIVIIQGLVSIDTPLYIEESINLFQNHPNPFNPVFSDTKISYNLNESSNSKIIIYNIKGEIVQKFHNVATKNYSGEVIWNGTDIDGKIAASGIYFYKLISDNIEIIKKMVVVR